MPIVNMSDDTMELIRESGIYTLRNEGVRLADGSWQVNLAEATVARLERHRKAHENMNDVVARVLREAIVLDGSHHRSH